MCHNHYRYIHIRSRSQLHSTLKLLHSKPLWARHGHPHKPLYKNRTTTLTHHTSRHLFFLFVLFFWQALPWPTPPESANINSVPQCELKEFLFSVIAPKHIEYLFQTDFLFPHVCSSVVTNGKLPTDRCTSLSLYLYNSSSPLGLRPGPNSRDFWHFTSPLTQSFGTPESPRWAWGDSRRKQWLSLSLSHTPNQLTEQPASLEKTVRVSSSVGIKSIGFV